MTEAVQNSRLQIEARTQALGCALLRGEMQRWPFGDDPVAVDIFVAQLGFDGIDALVFEYLALLQDCPPSLRARLRDGAMARAAWELQDHKLIAAALMALAAAGVDVLVYKGAALAYSLYNNPVWRTRSDCDLLVQPGQLDLAVKVLAALDYQQSSADEEIIFYQFDFCYSSPERGAHHIDLHWRLNNSEVLSTVLTFDELRSRALPVNRLSAQARTVSNVDALVIACLHRGAHQKASYTVNDTTRCTGDRLVWLYDIDQLVRVLSADEWRQFCALASAKGLAAICKDGLTLAASLFKTPLPQNWEAALHTSQAALPDRYLAASAVKRVWLDFLACNGMQRKIGYCGRMLFPSGAYMRQKYAIAAWRWLPWLYLRRVLAGISKYVVQDFRRGLL